MKLRFIKTSFFFFLTSLLLIGCASPAVKIDLKSEHEGGVVPINDEVISAYLSLPSEEGLQYVKENAYKVTSNPHDGQNVILSCSLSSGDRDLGRNTLSALSF